MFISYEFPLKGCPGDWEVSNQAASGAVLKKEF